jgi:hypothetical protein
MKKYMINKKRGFSLIYTMVFMLLILALSGLILTVTMTNISYKNLSSVVTDDKIKLDQIGQYFVDKATINGVNFGTTENITNSSYNGGEYLITINIDTVNATRTMFVKLTATASNNLLKIEINTTSATITQWLYNVLR